nr:uncharacterized protein LOC117609174 [Osmia lignaria]
MYCFVKMSNVRIFVVKQILRQFGTSNTNLSISRQSRYINKFIKQGQSSRRDPLDFSNPFVFGPSKTKVSAHVQRRVNVLNTVFMKYVTDLLSTGEIEPELLNRGIEISHVDITKDFKHLNIFWIDNNVNTKSDTTELLNKCAYKLRHELSQLKVIGCVPPVHFVKCKGISQLKEVEEKLKTLDFGEDHVPSLYSNAINCTVISKTSLSEEKEVSKNENSENVDNVFSVTLPKMRHDVFELDHFRIMSKIKSSLNKSRDTLRKQQTNVQYPSTSLSKLDYEKNSNMLTTEDQQEFSKFLIQRRKERKYKNKMKYCNETLIDNVPEEKDDDDYDDEDWSIDQDFNEDDTDNMNDNYYEDHINREFKDKH